MKFDKSKKSEPGQKEKRKGVSVEKPPRVITAEGWKNYLRRRYFSKK